MSCSLHDVVRLEAMGIATAAVGTEPFCDEALEVAERLGIAAYRMVFVPHPIQLLDEASIQALADDAYPSICARLVSGSVS